MSPFKFVLYLCASLWLGLPAGRTSRPAWRNIERRSNSLASQTIDHLFEKRTHGRIAGFKELMVALFWQLDVIGIILVIAGNSARYDSHASGMTYLV
jgi:hypothetical protein